MRRFHLLAAVTATMFPIVARAVNPLNTTQPSTALTFSIQPISATAHTEGVIDMFAGNFPLNVAANGSLAAISQYPDLFNQLGTTYGGDGDTNFVLPNFNGATPIGIGQGPGLSPYSLAQSVGTTQVTLGVPQLPISAGGGGQPFTTLQPSTPVKYLIAATSGIFPSRDTGGTTLGSIAVPILAQVFATVGNQFPSGYLQCNGQLLLISQNPALFSLLGTQFGGDGTSNFALPDLRSRAIVGADQGPGLTPRTAGEVGGSEATTLLPGNLPAPLGPDQPFNNMQPFTVLHYIIALNGLFPNRDGSNVPADASPYIGTVSLFAGNFAPNGWAFCDGQLMAISQNPALFSLLGTQYGGNGMTTFGLPDLRGRVAIGASGTLPPGTESGTETLQLLSNQTPAPEPASLMLVGLGTATLLLRNRNTAASRRQKNV